jgi:hypothetical protein
VLVHLLDRQDDRRTPPIFYGLGSPILEVAIGLLLIYWLLSVICSSINELISSFLKWRAKDLEQGIRNLLCDPDLFRTVFKQLCFCHTYASIVSSIYFVL